MENGEYYINEDPITFYWGDKSLDVVEPLDRDLKLASKYSPKIAHQARTLFAVGSNNIKTCQKFWMIYMLWLIMN